MVVIGVSGAGRGCELRGSLMCSCAEAACLPCFLHPVEVTSRALRLLSGAKRTCCNATSECFEL